MTGWTGSSCYSISLAFDSSIIVILLTAHGSIESAKEALRRGAFDYLEKPYDKNALLETINRALDRLDAIDTEIISASPKMEVSQENDLESRALKFDCAYSRRIGNRKGTYRAGRS